MEKELFKICPACKTENKAAEIMCTKCGSDISYVKAASKEENKKKNEKVEEKNNSHIGNEDDAELFRKTFSEELKPRNKAAELYPRTKEDDEAEKIIGEIKDNLKIAKNNIGKKISDFIKKIMKKSGE